MIWPNEIKYDNVLLFLTDAAPYMKKAGRTLKDLFPNILHITCLAHSLHRISEEIRCCFDDVDRLVSNGKKIFTKAPSRTQVFKTILPNVPLPPRPVITRWGTWIEAALYYSMNWEGINTMINQLEENAASITSLKLLLKNFNLINDLAFIETHYKEIPTYITMLENRDLSLFNSLEKFDYIICTIVKAPGEIGSKIIKKCKYVIENNEDLEKIKTISRILQGSNEQTDLPPHTLACFKYAPVTSVEVERSFLKLKHILTDKRHTLTFENLQKFLSYVFYHLKYVSTSKNFSLLLQMSQEHI